MFAGVWSHSVGAAAHSEVLLSLSIRAQGLTQGFSLCLCELYDSTVSVSVDVDWCCQ
jgi:hypothetical protein